MANNIPTLALVPAVLGMIGLFGAASRWDTASGIAPNKWGILAETASRILGGLIAALVFVACWIYAVSSWGWLLGIAFGWLPSAIIAWMSSRAWWVLCYLIFFAFLFLFR